MEENVENRLLPVLTALSRTLDLQSQSLGNVLEGEFIPREDFQGAIDDRFSGIEQLNVFDSMLEELRSQTILLGDILSVNLRAYDEALSNRREDERSERQAEVSEESSDTDSDKSRIAKILDSLKENRPTMKSISGNLKSALLAGLVGLLAPSFIKGLVNSFFGGETADKVKEVIDSLITPEVLGATALGTLLFGKKGGLIAGFLTMVFQKTFDKLEEKFESWFEGTWAEQYTEEFAAAGAAIVTLVTAFVPLMVKKILTSSWKGLANMFRGGGAAAAATTAAAAAAGTPSPDDLENESPEKRKERLSKSLKNMSDKDLKKAGITRTIDEMTGKTTYKTDIPGGGTKTISADKAAEMASEAKVLSKYPNFGKILKALKVLGMAGTAAYAVYILADDETSEDEKAVALSGLLGSLVGGVGGAKIAATLAAPTVNPALIAAAALVGGVGGAFLGDEIGQQIATWALGGELNPEAIDTAIEADKLLGLEQPTASRKRGDPTSSAYESMGVTPSSVVGSPVASSATNSRMAMVDVAASGLGGMGGGGAYSIVDAGGNITNNVGGSSSSTTINMFSSPDRALSNALPIPMSSGYA